MNRTKPLILIDYVISKSLLQKPNVTPMFEQGRKTTKDPLPDRPFLGIPFLLKDLMFAGGGPVYRAVWG